MARAELAKWEAIAGVPAQRETTRQAEERRRAEEKARILAAEAERTRLAREEAERKEREALNGVETTDNTGYQLSEETDENGHPFIISSDGTTSFGEITDDTGLPSAPIKLSEGYHDENGNGYGKQHIDANHGEQIRDAGFASIEDFVSFVAENYDKTTSRLAKSG